MRPRPCGLVSYRVLAPQRKAERLERLRDDPYYLMDDRPPPTRLTSSEDVDTIPVVRLDDLPPLAAQGTYPRRTPSLPGFH